MFRTMKSAVFFSAIVVVLCQIQKNESIKLNDILVRPDVYDNKPSLFKIARNSWEHARMKHFVQLPLESDFCYKMKLFCHRRDPRFCVFYDFLANIVGVQISFLKEDMQDVCPHVYNYTAVKDYIHTNFFGIPAYSARIYFTHPELLTEEGRQDTYEVAEGLWTTIDKKLVHIPRYHPNGPNIGTFYKQGCHPRMGTAFVNKFGPFDSCQESLFMITLYSHNFLIGFGVFAPGYGSPGPQRDWYLHAPVQRLMPETPPCVKDVERYNFTGILVYLIDNPRSVTCPK